MKMTDRAARRVAEMVAAESREDLRFRVDVVGGGCQGLEYRMSLDDEVRDDDTAVDHGGATLVFDGVSAPFLTGSVLDWKSDLMGERFEVDNPQASSSCGCGISFSLQ